MVARAMIPRYLSIMIPLLFIAACTSPDVRAAGPLTFVNETSQRIDTLHDSDYRFDALFVDFNSDGCPDAFIVSHSDWGATSRLWNNRCDGSGRFQFAPNANARYYIDGQPLVSGWVTRLDFNGDGKQDFWGRHGGAMSGRYRNGSTDGSFMPRFAAKENGCEGYCAFADITGKGNLEVITDTRLVSNISTRAQLHPMAGGKAFQVVGDVTGDGWPDILQPANGGYWRNDRGALAWVAVPAFTGGRNMQILLADFDNDGDLDLFLLDGPKFSDSTQGLLYRNNGSGGFTNVSTGSGLGNIAASDYGNIIAADFDNDGYQDLMVAGVASSVRLYRNNGNMTFTMSTDTNFGPAGGESGSGYETAKPRADVADFDNDGRLDIIKTQLQSNVGLWRSTVDTRGNRWMKVRVRGGGGNSDGIGASVRWYRPGTRQLVSHMHVLTGEQHPQTHLHTGLAGNQTVDLEVSFPNGGPVHRFANVASNQEVIVYRDGCMLTGWRPGNGWPLQPPANCVFAPPSTTASVNGAQPLIPPGVSQPGVGAAAGAVAGATAIDETATGDTHAQPLETTRGRVAAAERVVWITPPAVVWWRHFRRWLRTIFDEWG